MNIRHPNWPSTGTFGRRHRPKLAPLLLCLPLLLFGSAAWAHATIVFGTLTPQPNPALPGEPLELELELVDPASVPVEDAFVLAEFQREGEEYGSVQFQETDPAGHYVARLELPDPGRYVVTLRDQTYRQEEAVTEVELPVGSGEPVGPVEFVFPPTAVGGSLTTWLIWLIGLPVMAGVVVTLLVMRSGTEETASKERE